MTPKDLGIVGHIGTIMLASAVRVHRLGGK